MLLCGLKCVFAHGEEERLSCRMSPALLKAAEMQAGQDRNAAGQDRRAAASAQREHIAQSRPDAVLTLVVVVENGEVAPDVVAQLVDAEEDIALTPHPTGRDADGRMLFLAPDAGKALLLVLRYSFQAGGGASFTFTLVAM